MADEIEQVKANVASIVAAASATDARLEYILVPFSDPEVLEPLKTLDSIEYLDAVNALVPGGGGDCPEATASN